MSNKRSNDSESDENHLPTVSEYLFRKNNH